MSSFLTIKEVAKLTGIKPETLKKRCQGNSIPGSIKMGKTWLIPQTFLSSFIKPKVGVYIDGANILHGGLSSGWLIDYIKLLAYLKAKYTPVVISFYDSQGYELDAERQPKKNASGEYLAKKSEVNFYKFLQGIGIRVVTKPLKYIDRDPKKPKNNMDSYINIDVINEKDAWDILVLFSGDSDFERLVELISGLKKRVHIYSFEKLLSYELKMRSFSSPMVSFNVLDKLKDLLIHDRKKPKR